MNSFDKLLTEISWLYDKGYPDFSIKEDREALQKWLQVSYMAWVKPIDGVVKVYALQQMNTDWTPESKLERIKPTKTPKGNDQSFYFESESLNTIFTDATLQSSLSLRVYMVSGPPGVGKSEFIILLASQVGLSIYRFSLSSSNLTDNLLAQLLSQSSLLCSQVVQ